MRETLSIFITAIIFVLLIVIFPLYNYFERQDDMSYNLVLKSTTDFIDEVIYCGYISQEMYTDFASQLGNTGNAYDIQLEAHRKILVKSDTVDQYEEQYLIDYNDDIFSSQLTNAINVNDKVIKDGVYKLNVGDKIYIKLKNSSTTMAGALFNIIVPTSSTETIKINYGGIIQNNTWKQAETPLFKKIDISLKFDLNTNGENNANYNSDELKNGFTSTIYTDQMGKTYTIPNEVPTRTNCTFEYWSDNVNGTGKKYNPGAKISVDDNKVLYAIWGCRTITITLNANGGTPETQTKSQAYNTTYNIPPSYEPTRAGYSFDGWYTSATGGDKITSSNNVTGTSDITLYAHWKLLNMTITLETNGGNVNPGSYTGTYKEKYGSLPTPTKPGYTFSGWYLESSFTNKVTNDTTINTADNHILYAKWDADSYTVTFDGNGGIGTTRTVSNNSTIGTLPTSSRTGYTFNGWYTAKTGGTKISASQVITSDVTYYAQWTIKSYTVTFNGNGGTSSQSSRNVNYNNTIGTLPTATRAGGKYYTYTFKGWFTATSGGTQISAATKVTANVTYYAQWTTKYKTATVGNVTSYLNIHNQPNNYSSTVTGYVAKGTKVTVKGYQKQAGQVEGYYYVEGIPDARDGGTENGWLAETNLIFD